MTKVSIFFSVFFWACISPYDPKIDQDKPKLVVDGFITDGEDPHQVVLSFSAPYNNSESGLGRYITDATVVIKDNVGNQIPLPYKKTGIYEAAPGTKGEVGKSYTLDISLADGRKYQSFPEVLSKVPEIDTLYSEYEEFTTGFLRGEFTLYLDVTDPISRDDYYSWNWTHYEFKPYCQIILDGRTGITYLVDCCEGCWAVERCNGCINLMSDKLINGRKIARVPIVKIPYDSKEPYFLIIEQRSLTKNAYTFWKTVSQQINNSGGIFDKPPITITGNIFNVNNTNDQALGFFGASSIAKKSIYFDRSKVGKIPFGMDVIYQELNVPCRHCPEGPYRTTIKPEGWD